MIKAYNLKQIETPRLIIRPVELGDETQLNQAVNNSLESLQRWMPWANFGIKHKTPSNPFGSTCRELPKP